MHESLKKHWPEYLMEAAELGTFMISASLFAILLYHPASPILKSVPSESVRRILMGLAMGGTLIAIVYSPWGKQSGAHMNPAFTFTFYKLGKIAPWDAIFYIVAQFIGGIVGILLVAIIAGKLLAHPAVNYAATLPGRHGSWVALSAEVAISLILLTVVLRVSNSPRVARFTGLVAGFCVATFIMFESPVSGMSMNPARSLGSAVLPGFWGSLWIYFVAPPIGMMLAAIIHLRLKRKVPCAKYHHQNNKRCIFCDFQHSRKAKPADPGLLVLGPNDLK
jgi:aquaporin Z